MSNSRNNYWAIVPAAGIGKRFNADRPKQYLKIHQQTIIEHSLSVLLNSQLVDRVVVVLKPNDPYWHQLPLSHHEKIIITEGGAERYHSVLNGLKRLEDLAKDEDWVLVHDAARPCFKKTDLENLIEELQNHSVGGLLALKATDTIKRGDEGQNIKETLDRDYIWLAQTPQMFRYGMLKEALEGAIASDALITDESSALERLGFTPKLIPGNPRNIKITKHQDLIFSEEFLKK